MDACEFGSSWHSNNLSKLKLSTEYWSLWNEAAQFVVSSRTQWKIGWGCGYYVEPCRILCVTTGSLVVRYTDLSWMRFLFIRVDPIELDKHKLFKGKEP
jgi:hypothetical protein